MAEHKGSTDHIKLENTIFTQVIMHSKVRVVSPLLNLHRV